MKKYIKPTTDCIHAGITSHILASSGDPNAALPNGNVFAGGSSSGSSASGDANGNVEEMAKKHNAWSTWDD